jgi:hypothetical protein
MVGEKLLDRNDDQLVHHLGALAVRLALDALEQGGVVQDGFVGQFHRILRNNERIKATIASVRWWRARAWAACW